MAKKKETKKVELKEVSRVEILNDEDEVNGARKIRRKVISHLNIIFC